MLINTDFEDICKYKKAILHYIGYNINVNINLGFLIFFTFEQLFLALCINLNYFNNFIISS